MIAFNFGRIPSIRIEFDIIRLRLDRWIRSGREPDILCRSQVGIDESHGLRMPPLGKARKCRLCLRAQEMGNEHSLSFPQPAGNNNQKYPNIKAWP